jgi:hypothetical protein
VSAHFARSDGLAAGIAQDQGGEERIQSPGDKAHDCEGSARAAFGQLNDDFGGCNRDVSARGQGAGSLGQSENRLVFVQELGEERLKFSNGATLLAN